MLEPYTDDSLICIGLQMQQGYVGFYDLEQDTKHKDKYEFILNSDCFNEWYKKDITELKEKIEEQQAIITHFEEECKEKLDTFDKAEIEAINIIYEEKGFDGVIEYSRQKLYDYGVVKEKNGLVMMATGGWSDNEDYLHCLNHLLSNFGRNHYVGYLRGGAFYYSKDKYNVRTEIVVIDV